MKDKKSFQEWFYNYAVNNWKLTPKSRQTLFVAGGIVGAAFVTAMLINKKK